MSISIFKEHIFSDMFRQEGRCGWRFLPLYFLTKRSFRITFLHRLCHYSQSGVVRVFLPLFKVLYRIVCVLYNVDIPICTKIGKGLLLYHAYGLVIDGRAIIGDNVMLGHQVTIGTEEGKSPVLGDCVRVAPGAKIIGRVSLGSNVVVGANCVVINDVPENTITVGIPNRVIDRKYQDHANRHYWCTRNGEVCSD